MQHMPIGAASEYGRLRQAVVGIADGLTLPPFSGDLSHYNPELRSVLEKSGGKPVDVKEHFPERWQETAEQMDGVAKILEDRGVTVHRPRPFNEAEAGYLSNLQPGKAQLYPADPVFVIDKHYIEINIRRAYRRKEVFPLRDLIRPIVDADPDATADAMPPAAPWSPAGEGPGPFLEGGDIIILGNDLIVGMGDLCSNRAGLDWLERTMAPYGYAVHPVRIKGPILHALGIMCLLREGLLMAYLPAMADGLPEPLKDWDVIEITEDEMLKHATVGVSIDDKHYLIDPHFNRVMDQLVKYGVEPVPAPCDAIGFWGGAIRCITLPLTRDPV